ncbi:MAG TPA: hypothetical protein VEX39_04845 [Thermoleophilaceae bacterium]|nr:hypothetical protein [Thermoleophilaceae bacterium]
MRRAAAICVLMVAVLAAPAQAGVTDKPWPPATGQGTLFVHYGEEHWNDADGPTLLPKIVEESGRYKPSLVTMSGDKDNDGTVEQLSRWKQIMTPYDRQGVPFFPSIGNHDRKSPPGLPPGTAGLLSPGVQGDLTNYKRVFADRPFPFGDAAPYKDAGFTQRTRAAGDPPGASSHYFVDYKDLRVIFLDNSCWGLADCDASQSPAFPDAQGNRGQLEYLRRNGGEATRAGKQVFVVMHMPTRDPRDQSYIDPTTFNHVMGKGINPSSAQDNIRFEEAAQAAGVDGVLLGHIKGQFIYKGRGGVPYFIDGGAGGELYTDGPVGTDHGYWHGFRLLRVAGGKLTTDTVPIFVKGGIRLDGPGYLLTGADAQYEAFGSQPVFNDEAKVTGLELRDPDPVRPTQGAGLGSVGDFVRGGGWIFVPVLLLALGGLAMNGTLPRPRRRVAVAAAGAAGLGVIAVAGASMAQQSAPTTTPLDSLPVPARIFTSLNPQVIGPVASKTDDPRRDPASQTEDGGFRARCSGRTHVSITSGFETTTKAVRVASRRGRIVRGARAYRSRSLRAGRRGRVRVAKVRLGQPARVLVRIRRKGRTVRVLRDACLAPGSRSLTTRWDGRVTRRGKLGRASAGRYRAQVLVRSDRRTVSRSAVVTVRKKAARKRR